MNIYMKPIFNRQEDFGHKCVVKQKGDKEPYRFL